MATSRSGVGLALLARCASIVVFALVLRWVIHVEGGLGTSADGSNVFGWHALLFTLAFPVLMTEAILAFRSPGITDLAPKVLIFQVTVPI